MAPLWVTWVILFYCLRTIENNRKTIKTIRYWENFFCIVLHLYKTKIVSKFQGIISSRSDSMGILIFKHLTKTWPWCLHRHFSRWRHNRKDLCDWPEIFFKICLNGRNLKSQTSNRLRIVVWTQFWKNRGGVILTPPLY